MQIKDFKYCYDNLRHDYTNNVMNLHRFNNMTHKLLAWCINGHGHWASGQKEKQKEHEIREQEQ